MPIVPSRAKQIQELLARLGSESEAARDGAIARLTLLGPRAVQAILSSLRAADARSRLGMLEVLERLHDPRALPEILTLARGAEAEVARKAIGLAGDYPQPRTVSTLAKVLSAGSPEVRAAAAFSLARLHTSGVMEAIDPLLDVLLDEQEDDGLRMTILDLLSGLETKALLSLLDQLRTTANPALAARAAALRQSRGGRRARPEELAGKVGRLLSSADAGVADLIAELEVHGLAALELLLERLEGTRIAAEARRIGHALPRFGETALPSLHRALEGSDNLLALRTVAGALAALRAPASIPVLHRTLERVDARPRDPEVAATKAAIHLALAALGTRIALYDLREMLAARPCWAATELLQAAGRIGEASLVPTLVALAREQPPDLDDCAAAFSAIAHREKLRRTSAPLRALPAEHGKTLEALWAAHRASRTG